MAKQPLYAAWKGERELTLLFEIKEEFERKGSRGVWSGDHVCTQYGHLQVGLGFDNGVERFHLFCILTRRLIFVNLQYNYNIYLRRGLSWGSKGAANSS